MIEFVLGVAVALGCVAIVRRGPEVVERALVEADESQDRELDLMTWNDLEHTYALHDGSSGDIVDSELALALRADPDAHEADMRIASWNRLEPVAEPGPRRPSPNPTKPSTRRG